MKLTELSVKKPIILIVIFTIIIGLGILSFFQLGTGLLPKVDTPVIIVRTWYPGSASKEVENNVTKPIENSISGVSGIKTIRSTSGDGWSITFVKFVNGTKIEPALKDVEKAIDTISGDFPEDVTSPSVTKFDANADPIVLLSISGNVEYEELWNQTDLLKKELEGLRGIGTIKILGSQKKEVVINLDKIVMDNYSISIQTIMGVIKGSNISIPAGKLKQEGLARTIRMLGEFANFDEIGAIRIPIAPDKSIPLREVASIRYEFPDDNGKTRMSKTQAIGLQISKANNANSITLAKEISTLVNRFSTKMPTGIHLQYALDTTHFVSDSLSEVFRDLLLAIVVTAVVILAFLRNWRSSLIVLVAIPTSLLATLIVINLLGFTLNIISSTALALCIGILVDDSIVVLENIHRHFRMGKEAKEAAIEGRKEIGMAAIAITLCDVVVFVPIAFLNDVVGQFFREFGLTIVAATLFSLFVSFTLTPVLASRLFIKHLPAEAPAANAKRKFFLGRAVNNTYGSIVEWSLRHRLLVICSVVILLAGSIALLPLGIVSSEFMPSFDQSRLRINIKLDGGANLVKTDEMTKQIEDKLLSLPEVDTVYSKIGTEGIDSQAEILINLIPKAKRKFSQSQIASQFRVWGSELPGIDFSVTEPAVMEQTSFEGKKPLIINIKGKDRDELARVAEDIQEMINKISGVVDIENSIRSKSLEYGIKIDRIALSESNLLVSDVGIALRTYTTGTKLGIFNSANEKYNLIVRTNPDQVKSINDIKNIRIYSSQGKSITLSQVAAVSLELSPTNIERLDKESTTSILANLEGKTLGIVTSEIEKKLQTYTLPKDVTVEFSGDANLMKDSFGNLALALSASIILVYLVLTLLYNSFGAPLIRMLSLPAGIIGGFIALAITNKDINVITYIGIIMLDGLVSKNGTLLIDYTNTLIKRGLGIRDALKEAVLTRLRPIVMTSLTMIVGFLPLALASGSSAEIKTSLAILLIGGLISSTIISPILIPVIYSLIAEKRRPTV